MRKHSSRTISSASVLILAITLAGCGGLPPDASESTEQAVTGAVVIKATAFGNWSNSGVRTAGSYVTGIIGGVQHAGYFVFDLTSVAGKTVTAASLVLNNPANGGRENITSPKAGLRTTIRPVGNTPVTTLTGGSNNKNVFAQIAGVRSKDDFTYSYLTAKAGNDTFGLLTYESTRIPDLVKAAKSGTQLIMASYANNFGPTAPVGSNGSGDQFVFNGSGGVAPELHLTVK